MMARQTSFPILHCNPVKVMFLVFITAVCLFGCVFIPHDQTISDGEIEVIGGYALHGTLDCEPNEGPMATSVTITIILDRGSHLFSEIHMLREAEEFSWEFVRTPNIDPV